MAKYDPPWTLSVDGNGVYVHDADRNLIRAIENDEGEDQISLWSRIVDAVNRYDETVKALQSILDWRPDARPTVTPANAMDKFNKANAALIAIFDIAERTLTRAKAQGGA